MQKIIEFRGAAPSGRSAGRAIPTPPAPEPKPTPSIAAVFDSLSRTLDCIKNLCETIPDRPIREQLEAERAILTAQLVAVRTTTAQIFLPQVPPTGAADGRRLEALRAILPAASSKVAS